MNRAEHLQWAKDRAAVYLDKGDVAGAMASFISDMGKHDDLKDHPMLEKHAAGMWTMAAMSGVASMRNHINGFN